MKVIVGGTFGYLHKGHIALLTKAFEIGDYVYIGLTTDKYVKDNKASDVPGYSVRKRAIADFAAKFKKPFDIRPLNDSFGPSAKGDFDAIVVSEETYATALEINKERKRNGLNPLCVIKIPFVLSSDSKPISTSRIVKGEIDANGNPAT